MHQHNLSRIESRLQNAGLTEVTLAHFTEIDSTNSWLMQQPTVHTRVCIAEWQSAGRGRRGHAWNASPGASVLLSLGWQLHGANAAGLSLLSGLAVCAAIGECNRKRGHPLGLKWPNDIICNGRKLGGVLTELRGDAAVIGMGINVAAGEFSDDETRTDLQTCGYAVQRDELAAQLIIAHYAYLTRFRRGGFAPFVGEWNALNVHRDAEVRVQSDAEAFDGVVRGADDDGALLVECGGGIRRLLSVQWRVLPVTAS